MNTNALRIFEPIGQKFYIASLSDDYEFKISDMDYKVIVKEEMSPRLKALVKDFEDALVAELNYALAEADLIEQRKS